MHSDCPASGIEPAGHGVHAALPGMATWPGAHGRQASKLMPPLCGACVPAGQSVQRSRVPFSENVPGSHEVLSLIHI